MTTGRIDEPRDHPCLRCGACCAAFRVAFHWSESDAFNGGAVPQALTTPVGPHKLAMRGTDGSAPRCVALTGEIGGNTTCAVYARRPSPCRELQPAWLGGVASPQCDRARARHGLAPLGADQFASPR